MNINSNEIYIFSLLKNYMTNKTTASYIKYTKKYYERKSIMNHYTPMNAMELKYNNKIVLITGANRGLGLEIAKKLSDKGYRVIGIVRKYISSLPFEQYELDLNNVGEIKNVVNCIIQKYIKIDILINNAGIYLDDPRKKYMDISDLSLDVLVDTFKVNYYAEFELIKNILPLLINNSYGRIINISSGMGRLEDFDEVSYAYRASKLLINTLTITYGKYLEKLKDDVAIASVCPGWIRTDMGTEKAPDLPENAADFIIRLLECRKETINGKFLRNGFKLNWVSKEKILERL